MAFPRQRIRKFFIQSGALEQQAHKEFVDEQLPPRRREQSQASFLPRAYVPFRPSCLFPALRFCKWFWKDTAASRITLTPALGSLCEALGAARWNAVARGRLTV